MNLVVTALGWAGAFLSLASYVLVTTDRLKAQSLGYQAMVLFASSALAISAAVNSAWPSAVTNGIYMLIAVATIVFIARNHLLRSALILGRTVARCVAGVFRKSVGVVRASMRVAAAASRISGAPLLSASRLQYVPPLRRRGDARVVAGAGRDAGTRSHRSPSSARPGLARPASRVAEYSPLSSVRV